MTKRDREIIENLTKAVLSLQSEISIARNEIKELRDHLKPTDLKPIENGVTTINKKLSSMADDIISIKWRIH